MAMSGRFFCCFLGFCLVSAPPEKLCFPKSHACASPALLAWCEDNADKGLDNFASRTKAFLPLHSEGILYPTDSQIGPEGFFSSLNLPPSPPTLLYLAGVSGHQEELMSPGSRCRPVPEDRAQGIQHDLLMEAGQKQKDLGPVPRGKAVLLNIWHCPGRSDQGEGVVPDSARACGEMVPAQP